MQELRLPWNNKEGLLYGSIITLISCVIMSEYNVFRIHGTVTVDTFLEALYVVPILWVIVTLMVTFVIGRIADAFVAKFTQPGDSFYTKIQFNIIACVTMISATMTIIGPMVGNAVQGVFTLDPIFEWHHNWPFNFAAAFFMESLIAQPIARWTMKRIHLKQLSKTQEA